MKTIIDFSEKYDMLPGSGLVLAAVSGGADSMCLLNVLLTLSKQKSFTVAAVHYNHCLRGKASDNDADFVKNFCFMRNIPFYLGTGDVADFAKRNKMGTEEAARTLRYDFFYELAKKTGAVKIATAHTADDNAETVIMNLTRGAGLSGLRGIPPVRGILIRPMLSTTRAQVEDYIRENNIPYVFDASNAEDIYTRNKLRHNVLPLLKEINPSFCEAVNNMTELVNEDNLFIESFADEFLLGYVSGSISAKEISDLPLPVRRRVIRRLCDENISSVHVESIVRLCESSDPSASICLPSMTVYREYDNVVFSRCCAPGSFAPVELTADSSVFIPELSLKVSCKTLKNSKITENIHNSFNTFLFNCNEMCGNICVRPRITGDKISFLGKNGTKSLKKLFIEEHVPLRKRGLIPVIADDVGPMAVLGFGIDKRVASKSGDCALLVTFEETLSYDK